MESLMISYDIFNGDADGICALIQLRLAHPKESVLITGIKRDIKLLQQVPLGEARDITALDISLDKNREALVKQLENNSKVVYFDHHFAGEIPKSENLKACIDTRSNTCTSMIIDQYLKGAYPEWAIVGAFGDNMNTEAQILARSLGLSEVDIERLKTLGLCLNYNGYGSDIADLHFHPKELFIELSKFSNPFDFMRMNKSLFDRLQKAYEKDMSKARLVTPVLETKEVALLIFPDETWARRVVGVYANDLVNIYPDRAHAILTEKKDGYSVSVRSPLNRREGADALCMQFPSGGGRKAAAGINCLECTDLERFKECFINEFSSL